MKKLVASIVLFSFLALIGAMGIAQETPQQQQRQTMKKGMGNMDSCMMGGMMGNMSEEQRDRHMRSMQDHMLQMHQLSDQILAAKAPGEKEILKEKQLELMKTHKSKMMSHKRMMKQQQGQMRRSQQ